MTVAVFCPAVGFWTVVIAAVAEAHYVLLAHLQIALFFYCEFVKASRQSGREGGGVRWGGELIDVRVRRRRMTCFIAGDSPFG